MKFTEEKSSQKSTEVISSQKSTPRKNSQEVSDADVNRNLASVRRKLDLYNPRAEDERMDENDILVSI
ncbi:hypothetical protein OROMI_022879 [Orobanche minor]